VDKVRHYFNTPGFVGANAAGVVAAFGDLDETLRPGARLVFVTHSVPEVMEETSGPQGGAYSEQHRQTCAAVAEAAGRTLGAAPAWDLVYCSRSGPPTQAWLEPDVNDHLRSLHAQGVPAVVVSPLGFVSDHMEVKFDIDTEAEETARELGLPFRRAATVGTAPDFVAQLVDLALERAETARGGSPARPAIGAWGPSHAVCPVGCCRNTRRERPAACGEDWQQPVVPGGGDDRDLLAG
jgi:ferrochelatase